MFPDGILFQQLKSNPSFVRIGYVPTVVALTVASLRSTSDFFLKTKCSLIRVICDAIRVS